MDVIYQNKEAPMEFAIDKALWPVPHLHKELEIIYVMEGNALAVANRNIYELKPGDLFIAFPHQIHYYQTPSPGEYMLFIFPATILLEMEKEIASTEPASNVLHIEPGSPVAAYMEEVKKANGKYRLAEIGAYTNLIMSKILPQLSPKSIVHTSNDTIKSILEYCNNHYTEEISLDTIAQDLHLNKYYISHLLNNQTNMSLSFFINSLRIDMACRYLRDTDRKITEIAQDVGYDSIRSFNRAFIKVAEMTPKKYRERFKKAVRGI